MDRRVSVIVPTRNRVQALGRAVRSILAQTHAPYELIVVNDGNENAEFFQQIRLIDLDCQKAGVRFVHVGALSEARGGGQARNAGIEAARGEYVAFLDDDDAWLPEKLEKQLDVVTEASVSGVACGAWFGRWSDDEFLVLKRTKRKLPNGCQRRAILRGNFLGTTSGFLVLRQALLDVGGFDFRLPCLQDYDVYIRLILGGRQVGFISEPLILYRVGGGDQISKQYNRHVASTKMLIDKYRGREFGLTGAELNELSATFYNLAAKAASGVDRKAALKAAAQSACLRPLQVEAPARALFALFR
ncbi:glycosyltransferase family 2 protein [Alkalilimnicola ehrlichii]|uniref:glycosyltransferase family 2 protein n=1 Tax=Alkalilimnicola ehrlichii TaxID=351052 RepID=UPI0021631661|nr:glycosyltransferase family 2 protein [Alkalilimnicola ehrlichii]